MHFSYTFLFLPIALLVCGITHADPIVYIKNKSDRTIHIQPFIGDQTFEAQRLIADDAAPYTLEELGNNAHIDGIRVKYCMSSDPKYKQCNINPDLLSASGKAYEFKFSKKARNDAKKYYLKVAIEDDQASLEPQKGILGRTENMKWSLSGNIRGGDENIKGPTPYDIAEAAAPMKPKFTSPPTDMPPALPKQPTISAAAIEAVEQKIAELLGTEMTMNSLLANWKSSTASKKLMSTEEVTSMVAAQENNIREAQEILNKNRAQLSNTQKEWLQNIIKNTPQRIQEFKKRSKEFIMELSIMPTSPEDIPITLMPETLERKTIIPAPNMRR